ncbi:hypothetical protein TNCV_4418211 [Trichonephila clavipes]|nr:hypothetical protein TNCV_4418211 [Trichonephila clavipes]
MDIVRVVPAQNGHCLALRYLFVDLAKAKRIENGSLLNSIGVLTVSVEYMATGRTFKLYNQNGCFKKIPGNYFDDNVYRYIIKVYLSYTAE